MLNEYPVFYEKKQVGLAKLFRRGLYYQIRCKCRFLQKQVYRVYVLAKDHSVDLGICVPEEDGFVLNKLIPANRLGDGEYTFYATRANEMFVPVDCSMPFAHLADIDQGRMAVRCGLSGIVFTDRSADLPGNDQSPKCQNR